MIKTISYFRLKKELGQKKFFDLSKLKKKQILEKMKKFEFKGTRGISEGELKKGLYELRKEYKISEIDQKAVLKLIDETKKKPSKKNRLELIKKKEIQEENKPDKTFQPKSFKTLTPPESSQSNQGFGKSLKEVEEKLKELK